jgi:hypothetical protein
MIGKILGSQFFGGAAGYVAYAAYQEIVGSTPLYVPIAAWLIVSLATLWLLK